MKRGDARVVSAALWLFRLVVFAVYVLWELFVSSLRVAWDVVTPRERMKPAVMAMPIVARTDAEITVLANVISLIPGTLALDLSPDRRRLFLHVMYAEDPEEVRRDIHARIERRLLRLTRPFRSTEGSP